MFVARAAPGCVLAVVGCHANATMRYQARKVDIITMAVCAAHARDCCRAASCKDLPLGMIGAQAIAGVVMPWSVFYSVDYGYVAQPHYGGCGH